ncbi:hypothetical protein COU54_00655 [Candidatus Pacearchaeota archaeon CG10_big_fil_rev_8_21_14_0_10_31_24]|nr:MAG: hypothetical protein COU54_00655 [Candidatus Pacearchaeota archaeon CG10_big_fil_rev_8_21_14_0_10_31_24]
MLEMLMNPRKAERHPWELFFVGLFYASVSMFLVTWVFSGDAVLSKYSGILLVLFAVMFSMPFMYYTMKLEEEKINSGTGTIALLKEHQKAIKAFLWLFLGFVVAFSFWFIAFDSNESFKAQIETFCVINRPSEVSNCVQQYTTSQSTALTGSVTKEARLFLIFSNNIYVLIFTLLFSLVFGAGVIFVLAWNASVIAAAIGIFAQSKVEAIPLGLARYMIHGIPEIGAYFVVALAGGLVSIAVVKHETGTQKFWEVLQDSLNLIITSIVILFLAALVEVYVTPILF